MNTVVVSFKSSTVYTSYKTKEFAGVASMTKVKLTPKGIT